MLEEIAKSLEDVAVREAEQNLHKNRSDWCACLEDAIVCTIYAGV